MGSLVRNMFHQICITIGKDFQPILNMEVIFNRHKASSQLTLPKTGVVDLLVAKPSRVPEEQVGKSRVLDSLKFVFQQEEWGSIDKALD